MLLRAMTTHGVATISRLLKMIGLFCKRALLKRRYSAKETYNFKEPTNRSHPIADLADFWGKTKKHFELQFATEVAYESAVYCYFFWIYTKKRKITMELPCEELDKKNLKS